MSELKLYPMKEVKIIVEGEHLSYVTDLLDSIGISGYTIVPNISGKGHHGLHVSNPMTNEMEGLVMLLTVTPEDKIDPILAGLNPIFEKYTGLILVSDTAVSRKGHFAGDE